MSEIRGPGSTCPECGGPVRSVGLKTVKHLLDYPLSRTVAGEGWLFCADPECDVYYFRAAPEIYRAADIKGRARPHARGAARLVCHCFGYTAGDIAADARSGRHDIPAAISAEVKGGMCACEVLNPGGG